MLNLDSKIISFLRFPLIVGVVFIHNFSSTVTIHGQTFGESYTVVYRFLYLLFSEILARVSVPLFFLFSGYLFFLSIDYFNKRTYIGKLKKRFKSLLVPYLFWNISLLLFYYIISAIPTLSFFLNQKYVFSINYTLKALWAVVNDTYPINFPFWFIRDLMVIIVFSPFIFFYIKRLKLLGIVLLGILWYFWGHSISIPGINAAALFFFSLGAWFSINKQSFSQSINKKWVIYLYPLLIFVDLFTKNQPFNFYIHQIEILIGMYFWIYTSKHLVKHYKNKSAYLLSDYSFFIFALHAPLLSVIKKTIYITLKPENDLLITFLYFLIVVLVVGISLVMGYVLKTSSPHIFNFITGGRIINQSTNEKLFFVGTHNFLKKINKKN